MNTLPFPQEYLLPFDHLGDQMPQGGAPDADGVYHFGRTSGAQKVDLRLSRAGNVDMRQFMVQRVDDEPEAAGAVNDNQGDNNPTGAFAKIGGKRGRGGLRQPVTYSLDG